MPPTLVLLTVLTEKAVSPAVLTQAFTWNNSASAAGSALAAAVARHYDQPLRAQLPLLDRLIDEAPRRGLFGLQVAFVHPESTGGVLAELVSDE